MIAAQHQNRTIRRSLQSNNLIADAIDAVGIWRSRMRLRRQLAHLDDHLLDDIGLNRRLADKEAGKPFWRC